jgi:hypothetical protein
MAKAKKKAAPKAKATKKPAKAVKKSAAKKAAKPAKKAPPKPPAKAAKPAAKPAAKKPAPKKPAPKKPAKPKAVSAAHEPSERAKAAIAGDLAVLGKLVDGDRDTYRWFSVASDFGHADADERLAELREEIGDDDKLGETHFEVGVGYLAGSEGLPVDHDKARSQLASAKERGYTDASTLQRARGRLKGDALAVFDAVYDIHSGADTGDAAWGNEHTHNDPQPTVHHEPDDGDHGHDDE